MNANKDFICVDTKSIDASEISDIQIEKNKRIFYIRKQDKRLWIKSKNAVIKYTYAKNQFKMDSNEGIISITIDDELDAVVSLIDKIVCDKFSGTIVNNMMITENTIKNMFKESIYNGNLRLSLTPESCDVFDSDKNHLENIDFPETLIADTLISVVIEPTFVWMMNKKIGIHWDARQIQIHGLHEVNLDPNDSLKSNFTEETEWSLQNDSDDELSMAGNNNLSSVIKKSEGSPLRERPTREQRNKKTSNKLLFTKILSLDSDEE